MIYKANEGKRRSTRPPPLIVPSKTSVPFKTSDILVIFILGPSSFLPLYSMLNNLPNNLFLCRMQTDFVILLIS